ncbi:MAG: putative toxin-antitoxin system toxin component, PIN family [Candidatus Peregrinibacteria bacterium]
MKIVIDSNIFISGIFWKGASNEIIRLAEEEKVEICATLEIIEELFGALKRDKFGKFYEEAATEPEYVFGQIFELVKIYSRKSNIHIIKDDPSDDKFLACAIASGADFIVSGDKHLLKLKSFQDIPIVAPRQFINRFRKL